MSHPKIDGKTKYRRATWENEWVVFVATHQDLLVTMDENNSPCTYHKSDADKFKQIVEEPQKLVPHWPALARSANSYYVTGYLFPGEVEAKAVVGDDYLIRLLTEREPMMLEILK